LNTRRSDYIEEKAAFPTKRGTETKTTFLVYMVPSK